MPWMICVLACLFLAWRTMFRRDVSSVSQMVVGFVAMLVLLVTAMWLWPGGLVFQKAVAGLAMPCSLIWLSLIGIVILAWRRANRGLRYVSVAMLLFYTLFGNNLVAWALMGWLEADYRHIDAMQEGPFEVVFILGGAIGEGPRGQVHLADSGDRLMLGIRLYLNSRTEMLGCSGQGIPGYSPVNKSQAEIAMPMLRDLGIPKDQIIRLPGRNTREEIRAISKLARERGWKRIGLVTSAWHMRRAMCLAERAGVELEPLPADFRSSEPNWLFWLFVPDAKSFHDTTRAIKEILAVWVHR